MLYQTYGDDGFAPLSVIVQDIAGETPTSDDAALWAEEMALSFPVLADSTGAFFPVWDPDGVLPITVIIDQDGVVVWYAPGGADELADIEETITGLLEEN